MTVSPEMCDLIRRTALDLPLGAVRRRYYADTITTLGLGQREAATSFGWGRDTIRLALHEQRTGITCLDAFSLRGRKPAEFHLPELLDDIRDLVQDHLQTDPSFQTTRLYCRISGPEVRRQLIESKGYTDDQLPSVQTVTTKLNALGFRLRKVTKCRPKKKVPQTDAIFANVNATHKRVASSPESLRVSLDAKATVKIGPFSRGGYSRIGTRACDHDFGATGRLTPFGLFLPEYDELELFFTPAKVSSDFMVDMLEDWWVRSQERFAGVKELVLDLDNGPENGSYRSQFVYRLVGFAVRHQIRLELVYYPPYHSKYNPIERCWGILENYWRGELLDSEAAVLGYAASMKYNGKPPRVTRVEKNYTKGVTRTAAQRSQTEQEIIRKAGLERWSLTIDPLALTGPGINP